MSTMQICCMCVCCGLARHSHVADGCTLNLRMIFRSLESVVAHYAAVAQRDPVIRERGLVLELLDTPLQAEPFRALGLPETYIDVAIRYRLHQRRLGHSSLAPWMPGTASLYEALVAFASSVPFDGNECIPIASMDTDFVVVRRAGCVDAGTVELISGDSLQSLGPLSPDFRTWLLAVATWDACAYATQMRAITSNDRQLSRRNAVISECVQHVTAVLPSSVHELWRRLFAAMG